jgi:hypothetical protein
MFNLGNPEVHDMLSKVVGRIASAVAFSMLAMSLFAQYRAGIQGSMLDSQGDTINAASVTLTNKVTNRMRRVSYEKKTKR